MKDLEQDYKICPYCAEKIKTQAVKCRYCQSSLENDATQETITKLNLLFRLKRFVFGQESITNSEDKTITDFVLQNRSISKTETLAKYKDQIDKTNTLNPRPKINSKTNNPPQKKRLKLNPKITFWIFVLTIFILFSLLVISIIQDYQT